MTDPDTISADYTLRPSELADTLALLVEARQPAVVWGPPGSAKSDIAQQVAAAVGRKYVDVRACSSTTASPKSTWAWPGGWCSGTKASRTDCRRSRT